VVGVVGGGEVGAVGGLVGLIRLEGHVRVVFHWISILNIIESNK